MLWLLMLALIQPEPTNPLIPVSAYTGQYVFVKNNQGKISVIADKPFTRHLFIVQKEHRFEWEGMNSKTIVNNTDQWLEIEFTIDIAKTPLFKNIKFVQTKDDGVQLSIDTVRFGDIIDSKVYKGKTLDELIKTNPDVKDFPNLFIRIGWVFRLADLKSLMKPQDLPESKKERAPLLVARLGSRSFQVRQKAYEELDNELPLYITYLKSFNLEKAINKEQASRIEALIDKSPVIADIPTEEFRKKILEEKD